MAKQIDKTELEGASPVEAPENVSKVVAEAVGPKRSRKAKLKTETALAAGDSVPDYAALGVVESDVAKFESLRLRFKDLGRRSTSQVFECGEVVHELQELAPDQDSFARLAKGVLGLSRTGAENYGRVYSYLAPYRARLVQVGMVASALYDLATAEPEQVEEVLAAREAGQKLTRAQIKAMLGKDGAAAASPDEGGPGGLKAAIAEKMAFATRLFFDTLHQMLRDAHVALEPHCAGGPVNKSKAEAMLMHPARLAGGLIESLVYAAQIPGGRVPAGVIHTLPVGENRWAEVRRVLYAMGSAESWPKADKVGVWLAETVVPEFEWALGSERADKARAVLQERAAAAEAERVKAEKAKERAKLEQKKAREKAKREQAQADKRAAREAKAAAKRAAAQPSPAAEAAIAEPSAESEA